jgi:hypothetical protein
MPGAVLPPQPTLVMPQTLCLAFTEDRNYEQLRNEYHDGSPQAGQLAQTSRKTFKLSRRLTPAQLSTLLTFFESLNGGLAPFLFYNPFEAAPIGSNYDPTGASSVGRYVVCFRNNWTQVSSLRRSDVTGLELVEVAPMDAGYAMLAGFGGHGAITAATLNILTSHVLGTPSTSSGAMCSIDGLGLFSRGWLGFAGDSSAWTLRTDTKSLTPSSLPSLNVLFAIGSASPVTLTTPEQFLVYDCWISVVFADTTAGTLRPRSAAINLTWTHGTITDPENAVDGDAATSATIELTSLDTLDFSRVLVLSDLA